MLLLPIFGVEEPAPVGQQDRHRSSGEDGQPGSRLNEPTIDQTDGGYEHDQTKTNVQIPETDVDKIIINRRILTLKQLFTRY